MESLYLLGHGDSIGTLLRTTLWAMQQQMAERLPACGTP
jgi:hypothetical protein